MCKAEAENGGCTCLVTVIDHHPIRWYALNLDCDITATARIAYIATATYLHFYVEG